MPTQKSIVLLEKGGKPTLIDTEIPTPEAGELLVEIHATALNPIDWKMSAEGFFSSLLHSYPAVLGGDAAGIVKAVGEGVTQFAVGDKVFYEGFFTNKLSTFQQYGIIPADLAAKVPSNLSLDQAATLPITVATAFLGLYGPKSEHWQGAGLTTPDPWTPGGRGKYAGQPIFIAGGTTSVGQHVIQFAKLSGFSPIITTASTQHDALLKSLGVTHIIDRHLPLSELQDAVKAITSVPVKLGFDAVSTPESLGASYDLVAPGGKLVVALKMNFPQEKLVADKEVASVGGSVHVQRELGVELFKHLTALLESGDIKPNKVEVLPNGLNGIPAGLERLRSGKVSASKLVARPQET